MSGETEEEMACLPDIPRQPGVSPPNTPALWDFSSILIQQIIAGLRTKPRQPDFMTEKFKASGSLGCPKDGEAGRSP